MTCLPLRDRGWFRRMENGTLKIARSLYPGEALRLDYEWKPPALALWTGEMCRWFIRMPNEWKLGSSNPHDWIRMHDHLRWRLRNKPDSWFEPHSDAEILRKYKPFPFEK